MHIIKDKKFLEEQAIFNLQFTCESCRYFRQEKKDCAMLYPVISHLMETFSMAKEGERIYFCKMFEVKHD